MKDKPKFKTPWSVDIALSVILIAALTIWILVPANPCYPKVTCMNHLKQLYLAMQAYAIHNDDRLPWAAEGKQPHEHLQLLIEGDYINDLGVFRCPHDPSYVELVDSNATNYKGFTLTKESCSYTMNSRPLSLKDEDTKQPLLCDKDSWTAHNGNGIVILYLNGSVKYKKWNSGEKKLLPSGMYNYRSEK